MSEKGRNHLKVLIRRAAIKKRVNIALGSRIVEEKSYQPYA